MVVTEENSVKTPTKKKATLDQPKRHAIRAASTLADEREESATRKGETNHNPAVETGRNGKKNATVDERRTSNLTGTATEIANEARRTPRTAKLPKLLNPQMPR